MSKSRSKNRRGKPAATTAPPARKGMLVPTLLLLLFLLNGLNAAIRNSAVADEVGGHLAAGYLYWTTGKYSGGIANLPLAHVVTALPVVLLGRSYELFTEQHLVLFRIPVVIMGLLLGVALYRFAAQLFSRRAALVALFLYSFSPNILAHASLATLDLAIAFFVFLTVHALWTYVQRPHWTRMLALSLALAAALATKVQGLLLIPLVIIVLVASFGPRLWRRRQPPTVLLSWPLLLLVPWVFINAIYPKSPGQPGSLLPQVFLEALKMKLWHAQGITVKDQITFFCGTYATGGLWYYFPFAILVKTPLPTLCLLVIGALRRPSRDVMLYVALPVAVFLGTAMASSVNIGLRHVLIIYPFLFMVGGKGAEILCSRSWRGVLLLLLGVVYLGEAVWTQPHHLSYFNLVAGGPTHGHRLLIDSNHDWGQNDHFLRRYVEQRGVKYKVDPDAFHPTTGHILVNVSAFYGVYNHGNQDAYAWLRPFEPVNQIAHTWLEYDIPDDAYDNGDWRNGQARMLAPISIFHPWNGQVSIEQRDAALKRIERYLRSLERRYDNITNPQYRIALGIAYVATGSYGDVLRQARLLLEEDPGCQPALGLGGEVMVRWKLGILKFSGDERLYGISSEPNEQEAAAPPLTQIRRDASLVGISEPLKRLHYTVGRLLELRGYTSEAAKNLRAANELMRAPAGQP